jgi:hypothetical protein
MWSAVGVCLAVEFVMFLCFLAAKEKPEAKRRYPMRHGGARSGERLHRE